MIAGGLPAVGARVVAHDPWGYSGPGIVLEVQTVPHHAVCVRLESVTDRTDQTAAGRPVWFLAPHVTPAPA